MLADTAVIADMVVGVELELAAEQSPSALVHVAPAEPAEPVVAAGGVADGVQEEPQPPQLSVDAAEVHSCKDTTNHSSLHQFDRHLVRKCKRLVLSDVHRPKDDKYHKDKR